MYEEMSIIHSFQIGSKKEITQICQILQDLSTFSEYKINLLSIIQSVKVYSKHLCFSKCIFTKPSLKKVNIDIYMKKSLSSTMFG